MNVLINYADNKYRSTQKFNSWTGRNIAKFDKVIEYSPENIDKDFISSNKKIFSVKRGNGLWLWKPYFLLKTLLEAEDGDIIFYCDSGSFFIRNIDHILRSMGNDDIWVSNIPLIEKQFTKMDAFILMDCLSDKYFNTNQIQSGFIAVRKTKSSINFVEEWLYYCSNYQVISPTENKLGQANDPSFISHREDQSVLSLLVKKHEITPHTDPTQYGRIPQMYKHRPDFLYELPNRTKKEFPVTIVLHRERKVTLKTLGKGLIKAYLPIKIVNKLIKT